MFPAPTGRRVVAGALEVWIGVFLMLGFSVLCRLPQLWALWHDVVRIQAEDFSSEGPETLQLVSENKTFMGKGVLFKGNESLKTHFPGPSGSYYIVSAYGFREEKGFPGDVAVIIGDRSLPFQGSFGNLPFSQIEELGGPVWINKGEAVYIKSYFAGSVDGDSSVVDKDRRLNFELTVDYLEFVPEGSSAYRPKGWEYGYKYIDFYRAINYDDMNLHFFLGPLPLWIFGHLFIVQLLFSRTLGGMVMGLHIQTEKTNERISPWTAFLRTVCWFFIPFWAWTAIGKEHQWIDTVSGSRVVVFRD